MFSVVFAMNSARPVLDLYRNKYKYDGENLDWS